MLRLRERLMAEKLAEGWSLDESHGLIVPPGWVRDGGPEPREAG
jgi:hypothetical protein